MKNLIPLNSNENGESKRVEKRSKVLLFEEHLNLLSLR